MSSERYAPMSPSTASMRSRKALITSRDETSRRRNSDCRSAMLTAVNSFPIIPPLSGRQKGRLPGGARCLTPASAVNQSRGASARNTLKTGSACAAASTPVTSTWRSFSTYFSTSSSCFWKIFASSSVRLIRASLATYATSRSEFPAMSGAQGCKWLMSNMTATPNAAKRIRKTIRPCRRSLRIARGRRPLRSVSNTCGASIAIET